MNSSAVDLDEIFEQASQKYGVSVKLLKAVAKAESDFNPNATSGCGAMGVMQLMPGTAKGLGVTDAYDPEQNIMGGAKYLSGLLKEFNGDTKLAVAAYNAGPGSVQKYGGVPPYSETQAYVKKVLASCGEDLTAGTAAVQTASSVQESSASASPTSAIMSSLLSAASSDEKDDPMSVSSSAGVKKKLTRPPSVPCLASGTSACRTVRALAT